MFYVYILYSKDHDRFYIGQTSDLEKRITRHQKGYVRSTKNYLPIELVYKETFNSRSEAVNRENLLKSWKSKERIRRLVDTSR